MIENNNSPELLLNPQVFDCFEDCRERKKFIRKTFGYFLFSMLCTFSTCIAFNYSYSVKLFVNSIPGQIITGVSQWCLVFNFCALMCFYEIYHHHIWKYAMYLLLTLGISWTLGFITMYLTTKILLSSIFITTGTTLGLTIYSLVTEIDFTKYFEYYFIFIVTLILMSFSSMLIDNSILHTCLAGGGSLLFSFLIITDIQMIVAQKHIRHRFNLNDSIFAAINLYLDVINLFLYLIDCMIIGTQN